ncbi:MAG: MDR family MFS transporter [Hyphomonadaceae bacterium]
MDPEAAAARGPITISIMLAAVMSSLDSTIATVAVPHMQASLSAGPDQISWVLTSYIVAMALTTPLVGVVAARIGRKNLLLMSVLGFTLASLACGIATSLPEMVFYRLLQGAAGASFMPLSQAILLDINPPEKHGSAMSIWSSGVVLGPILGPALGGFLTEELNWRWVFLINLPVGVLAFTGVWLSMPRHQAGEKRRFDIFGYAALALFIAALQMFLDRGSTQDWFNSKEIWFELALALIGLYLFALHSATTAHPFFDPAILRDGNFLAGCLLGAMMGVLLYSAMAMTPPLTQQLLGYPVVTSGLVVMPRGFGMLAANVLAGRLARIVDARVLVLTGLALNAYSSWQMSFFTLDMGAGPIIFTGIVQGLGVGLIFVPIATVTFAYIPGALRNEAASLFTLTRNMGASIGIATMQALFVRNSQAAHADLAPLTSADNPLLQGPQAGPYATSTLNGLAALDHELTRQATMISYIDVFHTAMILSLCSMPLVLFMRPMKFARAAAAPPAPAPD